MRKLMKPRHSPNDYVIADMHMSGQSRFVRYRTLFADMYVVGEVHALHNEAAVSDRRRFPLADGAVDGDIFAADYSVSDDGPGFLAFVAEVLRHAADDGVFMNDAVRA